MDWQQIRRETQFRAVRSSGSGGQHVNKVSTKVVLTFKPLESAAFTADEKALLAARLEGRLSGDGALSIAEQRHRSQAMNRKLAWERLQEEIRHALRPLPPTRKPIKRKVNRSAARKARTIHAEKKRLRRKIRPHQL